MNTQTYFDTDGYDTSTLRMSLRGAVGVAAMAPILVGFLIEPAWVFFLSMVSLYVVISAIIGTGMLSDLYDLTFGRDETEMDADMKFNVGSWDRAARAVTATATLGIVVSGIVYPLSTYGYFVLSLVGFYTGLTAIIRWDPFYSAMQLSSRGLPAEAPIMVPVKPAKPVVQTVTMQEAVQAANLAHAAEIMVPPAVGDDDNKRQPPTSPKRRAA